MPDTEYICCPLCGWWRSYPYGENKQTGEIREVRFDKVDPATAPMMQRRRLRGAGKSSKKARIETLDSKTLTELPEEIKEQIRTQCHRILGELE